MLTYATRVIADDNFHVFMLIAAVLFIVAAVLSAIERAWTFALVSAGLAFIAFAYVIVS